MSHTSHHGLDSVFNDSTMSGGRLVVLDRLGRDDRSYELPSGMVTLGSDPRTDIKIMMPNVSLQHAKVVVHANQTIVRNVGSNPTLVNGRAVSVAALQHGDVITVGGRELRWEYLQPNKTRRMQAETALVQYSGRSARTTRPSEAAAAARSPTLQLALELRHRASMPASASAKQVAIVTPQRRDTNQNDASEVGSPSLTPRKSVRATTTKVTPNNKQTPNKVTPSKQTPNKVTPANTTKATLWLEARKSSPRNTVKSRSSGAPQSARKATPLRLAVLRKVQSARKHNVAKIQEPSDIDYTKQAAIRLMTRHTPKSTASSPNTSTSKKTPSFVPKKPSPVRKSKSGSGKKSARTSKEDTTPKRDSTFEKRKSKRTSWGQSVSVLEITDSDQNSTIKSRRTTRGSSLLPSPKKSALKDPKADKSHRKTESIKFDLSNLENFHDDDDVTHDSNKTSEDDLSLHYSDTSAQSPSPRRSINSRSSKILQKTLGTTVESVVSEPSTLTPQSPSRKSSRGSIILQKALRVPDKEKSRYSSRTTKSVSDSFISARKTLSLSPRSPTNGTIETYSVVDLVSIDSNESGRSTEYNSAGSVNSSTINFGTPNERKTRSTIDPNVLISSTPYVGKTRRSGSTNTSPRSSIIAISPRSSSVKAVSPRDLSITAISPRNSSMRGVLARKSSIKAVSPRNSSVKAVSPRNSTIKAVSPRSSSHKAVSTRNSSIEAVSPRGSSISIISPRDSSIKNNSTRNSRKSASINSSQNSTLQNSVTKSIRNSSVYNSTQNNTRYSRNSTKRSISSPNISSNSNSTKHVTRRSKSLSTPENTTLISGNTTRVSRRSRSKSRLNDSELLLLDITDVDDSPKSSKRASRVTANKGTPNQERVSRRNLTINTSIESPVQNDGIVTPENTHIPEEPGTPMFSIQSLLDSSQGSVTSQRSVKKGRVSFNPNRNTIAAVHNVRKSRNSARSKSFNIASKTRSSDLNRSQSDTEIATPKSAVKLIQEAVKNKHSSAKKPQSKRSIIDNLNDSTIVKELFNSPVKRKLSQSMTEFSRKQLFDDDEVPSKRPTRNTIAAVPRSPDDSILEHSDRYTPDVFVSPIHTPEKSPNLSGVKLLFRRNKTPTNDLRYVTGVKDLLRSPRTRKSVKNDLTNVGGIKNVFAKSPKNRLSDVRGVKEIFAAKEKNDLRRVTGVKTLFQEKGKSPKNDLSDVRGVRSLFQKNSPLNDLRNVSGVKKGLKVNSPKNDLTDVRGVRKMFKQNRQTSNDLDVSGIEELFNESNGSLKETSNAESLFDQLVGRAVAKAVYSKSVVRTQTKAKKKRQAKSLASLDVNTNNVEDWLENELRKRVHNVKEISKNKSIDKSNKSLNKELLKLATDTVEGNDPMRTSRVRNSTITRTTINERQKSASELYSAHTLPIKKRSFVEPELVNNIPLLPIKKRTLMHSTPVKGRSNMTMNASELGRVSPIVPVDKTRQDDEVLPPPTVTKARGRNASKVEKSKAALQTKETVKTSPVKSPLKTRAIRSKANSIITNVTNTKKRKSSLVVAKKSPVMSPKPAPRKGQNAQTKESPKVVTPKPAPKTSKRQKPDKKVEVAESKPAPKTTRRGQKISETVVPVSPKPAPKSTRRGKKADDSPKPSPKKTRARKVADTKPTTPKASRAKVQKGVVVVTKPSPVIKPKPSNRGKKVEEVSTTAKRSRRTEKVATPVKSPPKRRRAADNTSKSQDKVEVEKPQIKRGRKTAPLEEPVPSKKTRKTQDPEQKGRKTIRGVPKKIESKTRGKMIENPKSEEAKPVRRGRQNQAVNNTAPVETSRKKKDTTKLEKSKSEEKPVRGKRVTEAAADKKSAKGKGKAVKKIVNEMSEEAKPVRRGRNNQAVNNTAPVETSRKKKDTPKLEKSKSGEKPVRGKRMTEAAAIVEDNKKLAKGKGKAADSTKQAAKPTKAALKVDEPRPVRGTRKLQAASVAVVEAPKTGGRKRKTDVEDTKKQPAAKKARQNITSSPVAKRSTRAAKTTAVEATTRSRRR